MSVKTQEIEIQIAEKLSNATTLLTNAMQLTGECSSMMIQVRRTQPKKDGPALETAVRAMNEVMMDGKYMEYEDMYQGMLARLVGCAQTMYPKEDEAAIETVVRRVTGQYPELPKKQKRKRPNLNPHNKNPPSFSEQVKKMRAAQNDVSAQDEE